jgi:hypothetical protein
MDRMPEQRLYLDRAVRCSWTQLDLMGHDPKPAPPFSAMRSRVSASAIGASTQASRTTAYLGTSGIVLPGATLAGFLQGGGIVFGAAAVDASGAGVFCHPVQGRSAFFAPLLHVAEQIGEHDPAVPARLVVGDLFLVEEFH